MGTTQKDDTRDATGEVPKGGLVQCQCHLDEELLEHHAAEAVADEIQRTMPFLRELALKSKPGGQVDGVVVDFGCETCRTGLSSRIRSSCMIRAFGTWKGSEPRGHRCRPSFFVHVLNGWPPRPWMATMLWRWLERSKDRIG